MSNSVINVNVPSDVKEEATELFNDLGMNMTTAINIFLKKSIEDGGIPFEVKKKPSYELKEALNEIKTIQERPEEYKSYHNVDELFEDLDSEVQK